MMGMMTEQGSLVVEIQFPLLALHLYGPLQDMD
jgi:hypothetical protein